MRHRLLTFLLLALLIPAGLAYGAEKVILDTDMVEGFDDGAAMIMLARAPNIELMGVTTVAGNSWVPEGTAYAIKQLEMAGRKIPVTSGTTRPLRPHRYENFEVERWQFGLGPNAWVGAFNHAEPASWLDVFRKRYGQEPGVSPDSRHSVEFIIQTVRKNPGQITIVVLGPVTNLALAVRQAPDIVPLVKRVIYMGGTFNHDGNVTSTAEFNWWFDPEAARIAVRTPFKEQVLISLDLSENVPFSKEHFNQLLSALGKRPAAALLRATSAGRNFIHNPGFETTAKEVIAAAVIIEPGLITKTKRGHVDVNADYGLAYGQSILFAEGSAPIGAQPFNIITEINQEGFWRLVCDPKYWGEEPAVQP